MTTATDFLYQLRDTESVMGEQPNRYVLRVKDMADDDRPREKLQSAGPGSLSMTELMAVVLGVGTKKEEVMTMAGRILKQYGEQAIMNETSPDRLSEQLQIPLPKACQVIASLELGRRLYQTKAGRAVYISTAQQAFEYLRDMSSLNKEQLKGLYLNSRYQVIHEEIISIGSLTSNIVHPREVFQPAIEHGAVAVILAHNHPSGKLDETYADIETTERLVLASKILGIDLLDHLIIASDQYKSIISQD